MSYDLTVDKGIRAIAMRTRDFINEIVIPHEGALSSASHGMPDDLRHELQKAAKSAGVFAPTARREYGGLGLDHRAISVVLEESGRSLLGPAAMNCAAPDEGNILLLDKVGTDAQKRKYLAPLSNGAARSCFAMTEPSPGAGADPQSLNTTAARDGDEWVINGNKWFITGATGAAFCILMAKTSGGATMFLVDSDNPGMRVDHNLNTMDVAFSGGHGYVIFENARVGADQVLGSVDEGFRYAQVRLGPARLTHCMRWLGAARRAHESAVGYAATRPMFGGKLGDLGMAQQMIADNEIDIAASRALIWQAAWALDQGKHARQETSVAKVFVAEATFRVADRSMQICGGSGIIGELPIARIFQDMRPFRIYDGPSEVHRWSIARRSIRTANAGQLPGDWM